MPISTSQTLRTPVHLPSMPDEAEAAERFPPVRMARARLRRDELAFDEADGFERTLEDGFFLLAIPDGVDLDAGDRFVRHFHLPASEGELSEYTGYKARDVLGDYQGYFDRPHDQWENYYVERANWSVLPSDVRSLGGAMADLGIGVLRATLRGLAIPEAEWPLLTGGLSEGSGHQMLAFNHFRSDKTARGSKFHRDSGWVTILRSTERGLLAYVRGELRSIDPVPGHFIVNFGSSIEVLTEHMTAPVRANVHGVARTLRRGEGEDRASYVVFLDSDLHGDIFQYGTDGPRKVQSVAEFAAQEVARTYDDDDGLL